MNILKVTQSYYPYLEMGGQAVKVRALAEHLSHRGHRVTVLTAHYGHPFQTATDTISDVEIIYLSYLARYRAITLNPGVWHFCRRRLHEFDVVHIYGLYDLLGPVVAWLCRRLGILYVVEPMGMHRPIIRSLYKKRLYHRFLGRGLVEGAACLIATSEQECRELVEDGIPIEKVAVRRNGLDLSAFENLPPRGGFRQKLGLFDREPLVIYLGRLSRKKGLDLLLRAFASLSVSARLIIIGPDDRDGCVQEIEYIRDRFGLQKRVFIIGPRFGMEKLEALVDADLFVLPSRNENFGNAVAEAIACSVPVIVTDRCGIAPYIRDRVGLVVPCNVEALRRGIEHLLTNRELTNRFRASAIRVRQELSWGEPVTQQEWLYKAVIAGATRRK